MRICYDLFPYIVGGTLAVVFVVVGCSFRTVVVPLRAIVTITMSITFTYGMAAAVYEDGALNWVGFDAFSGQYGAISWFAPVMAFSVCVGLGLDYDVFIISRIHEYRLRGFSDVRSIQLGLEKTGSIITAAGMIMAIAFSGLFLSSEMTVNQVAFYLVFAVVLDTFIVRTLLVPAFMTLIGRWNWWPQRLPMPVEDRPRSVSVAD